MAVLQMQRISICALKKERKAILEELQSLGMMEMNQVVEPDEDFQMMDTAGARSNFEKAADKADRALEVLDQYAPVKKSMLAGLAGKELVDRQTYADVVKRQDAIMRTVNQIHSKQKQIAEQKANILKLENNIETLSPWLNLDISLRTKGTVHTEILIGTIPGSITLENLYALVAEPTMEDVTGVDFQIISTERDTTYLTAICLKKDVAKVEETLRSMGFAKASVGMDQAPAEEKLRLENEISQEEQTISLLEEEIRTLSKEREDICLVADYYRTRAEKYVVLGQIPQSSRTFLISGYAPKEKTEELKKLLEDSYNCSVEIEELEENEEAPVLLKNNRFAESAEGVLASFGLPAKGEMDPTSIMSIFYVFLFGLMLSDAAYGLIVSVACFVVIKKFPRMEINMRKSIQLFFWCGLSTLFWGIMFGGYFGDVINVISRTFFGHEVGIPALWFVPLNDPMRLLIYSMLFGIIHLYTGLALKGYMCLRDKKYMDFVCDVVLWFCLLTGLILMLLPTELFSSMAQMKIVFPAAVNMLAKGLAIVGALGILFFSGRDKKNFGLRIALGAYDLYNITGWLSDVLSYSRLLALGLATGVIASVVNQMGSMVGKSFFGVIVFILVFIVGHLFNMGINLLGAYVHTCRLQYVEFFGKFYEGGGREFHPFKTNTKYADIVEHTK